MKPFLKGTLGVSRWIGQKKSRAVGTDFDGEAETSPW